MTRSPLSARSFALAALLLAPVPRAAWADCGHPPPGDHDEPACSGPQFRDSYACRQILVKYGDGFDASHMQLAHPKITDVDLIPQLHQAWVQAASAADATALLDELHGEPGVLRVERNGVYLSPECRQFNIPILDLTATTATLKRQAALAAMRAVTGSTSGTGVTVAILDTGVDRSHPDLAGASIAAGTDLVSATGTANDVGDGIDEDLDGITDSGWGHGTAVAGLVHLIAPAATILPIRVLDDECSGKAYALAAGIVAATDAGARIINASLGASEDSAAVEDALRYASDRGVLIVAAAGNAPKYGDDRDIEFPARSSSAIAVAAVDNRLVAASFTLSGPDVAMSAPGVSVLMPWRYDYARGSGTSFSTAFVSAAAAVGLGAHPWLDRRGLVDLLKRTAIPVDAMNPYRQGQLGAGVPALDALAGSGVRRMRLAGPMAVPGGVSSEPVGPVFGGVNAGAGAP